MVAAAIVCAAAMSHAAAVTWYGCGYANGDPNVDANWFTGGQAYLVLVTDAANFNVTCDNGAWNITGGEIVSSGGMEIGEVNGTWNGAEGKLSSGTAYNMAVIVTTAGTSSGLPTEGYWGVSNVYAMEDPFDASTGGAWSIDPDFNGGNGVDVNTAVGAVPEPASGLLLLLGVAGLALKRRRT